MKNSKDLTNKEIEEFLTDIFYNRFPDRPRKIKGMRGCITYGWAPIDSDDLDPHICGDPSCISCVSINDAIMKAIKEVDFSKYIDDEDHPTEDDFDEDENQEIFK